VLSSLTPSFGLTALLPAAVEVSLHFQLTKSSNTSEEKFRVAVPFNVKNQRRL